MERAKTKNRYSTSDLTKRFGVGRNTLRLYEEMGLLDGMNRTEAGYRVYSDQHLDILKFVIEAKKVGFTLKEIKLLLDVIAEQKSMTCGSVSQEIKTKINDIEKQISILSSKKNFLAQFHEKCESKGKLNKCDVVSAGFNEKACC